jgi:DeoR/GlpR family transcriptional regulator of sugar metabolism
MHKEANMLAAERKQLILSNLAKNGKVLAGELSTYFSVSEDTIRRDLRELASEGLLLRVHGGALPKTPTPPRYNDRRTESLPAKAAIGAAAASLVRDGQVIIIDGGTTPGQVAHHLPPSLKCTVVTHSIPVINALAEHPNIELVVIGGTWDRFSQIALGATTLEAYRALRADICFLGMAGLHAEVGLSDRLAEESYIKRILATGAAQVIGLATAEKLGTVSTFSFAPITALTQLITDNSATDEQLAPFRAAGIHVIKS